MACSDGLAPEILETFEAAGIVNPRNLAELQICHYPALGVQQPGDRKKLFHFVQKVKLAVPDDDQNNEGGIDLDKHGNDLDDILDFSNVANHSSVSSKEKNGWMRSFLRKSTCECNCKSKQI